MCPCLKSVLNIHNFYYDEMYSSDTYHFDEYDHQMFDKFIGEWETIDSKQKRKIIKFNNKPNYLVFKY